MFTSAENDYSEDRKRQKEEKLAELNNAIEAAKAQLVIAQHDYDQFQQAISHHNQEKYTAR